MREAARRAAARHPGIRQVILFGSLASGVATPRSDADLLIVMAASDKTDGRDRVPVLLAALSPLPCPIDLFVLNEQEVEHARKIDDPFVREVLAHGIDLLNTE